MQEVNPDINLLLAGSSPHKRVSQLANNKGVEVSGWLDDIRDAYATGRIFLAPMLIGTGLQNKLLEAMAMGLPCVTSPLANRSLKAIPDRDLIVGDEAESYSAAILNLLQSPTKRDELGKAGREFVQERFSWSQSVERLEELMIAQNKDLRV